MQSYAELVKIGRKYYSDKGFCSVVALASVADISFGKARAIMDKHGRKHCAGATLMSILNAVENRNLKYTEINVQAKTMKTISNELRHGKYLVFVRGHVAAVVDGVINDWTEGRAHRIVRVFKVN